MDASPPAHRRHLDALRLREVIVRLDATPVRKSVELADRGEILPDMAVRAIICRSNVPNVDPGGEPMCADGAAMKWMGAYMSKGTPPKEFGFVTC